MGLSERARMLLEERQRETMHNEIDREAMARKREVYWIGFLAGALSSRCIEPGEEDAILAEAERFQEFFVDADASDLAEDIRARCFDSEADMIAQMREVIAVKRDELEAAQDWSHNDEANEFLGFCAGIVCDGRVLEAEAGAILARFRESAVLMESAPFADLRRAVDAALADRVLTAEESEEVREWIARLVGDGFIDTGVPNIGNTAQLLEPITDPGGIDIAGRCFVLTGPMRMGTRSFIVSEIERCGGKVGSFPSRHTDYVVVSSNASRHWRTTHFGTKIERAKELAEQGVEIAFCAETALEGAIAACGQH